MAHKKTWVFGGLVLVLILAAGLVFGQGGMHHGGMNRGAMHGGGMHRGAMHGGDMRVESEADYLAMMIPHHAEAVERSRELLEITGDEAIAELLESIIAEQTAEIELMEGWLADRYPDFEPGHEYEPMMRPYDGLTAEESVRVFLEDMIPHHMHAIMSSHELLRSVDGVSAETRELASNIITSQRDEIHLMHDLYARISDESTPHMRGSGHRMR
ncbi:MAG: DUF305 domain-containing protein [Spirochaetaceae bacterium]|nr:MAG: DUF305 domain-containing protein [Spirochaetaceae bacterium]